MKCTLNEIIAEFKIVVEGKKIINKIIKEENINLNMDFLIILPEDDLKFNIKAILYLNLLIKIFERDKATREEEGGLVVHNNEKFVIVTQMKELLADTSVLFPRASKVVAVTDNTMNAIIKRYEFIKLNNRILVIGNKKINGGDFCGLYNKENMSDDVIIPCALLNIHYVDYIKYHIPEIDIENIQNSTIKKILLKEGLAVE